VKYLRGALLAKNLLSLKQLLGTHTSLFSTKISWSVYPWQASQPEPTQEKFLTGALLAKILLSLKQLLATNTLAYFVPTLGGVFAPGKFGVSEVLPITL
jgi:hypothetical protein